MFYFTDACVSIGADLATSLILKVSSCEQHSDCCFLAAQYFYYQGFTEQMSALKICTDLLANSVPASVTLSICL